MRISITLFFIGIFALLPSVAAGQSVFDEYRKKKAQEINAFNQTRKKQIDDYVERKRRELDRFRKRRNEIFANYLSQPWNEYKIDEAVVLPKDEEVRPIANTNTEGSNIHNRELKGEVISLPYGNAQPRPEPEIPVMDNDEANGYGRFMFYGTPMKVRWGDAPAFQLKDINEKAIAKAYEEFTDTKYNNLLSDCLQLRDEYDLCDWAYYKMLEQLATAACGKGTNEAIFLQGFLFHESGYLLRFAFNPTDKKLHLLVGTDGQVLNYKARLIDGKKYYLFDGCTDKELKIADFNHPNGNVMRMGINKLPKLDEAFSSQKTIRAASYPIIIKSRVNKNLVEFFNDYPSSICDGNIMTRWAYYANTPLSDEVKKTIYPLLKEKLQNITPLMAANMLLNWVQPLADDEEQPTDGTQIGFPYLHDDIAWGKDRAFFAEETLYYPGSDCEDHSIIYSHLVRDLLGLDVALVYYPGHLATAICFNEDVKGDYIMIEGRKFMAADPTWSRSRVGMVAPEHEGETGIVIVCKRLDYGNME